MRALLVMLVAGALLAAAPAARATDVIVVGPNGTRTVDDPYLPAPEADDGAIASGTCHASRRATTVARSAATRPTVSGTVDRVVAAGAVTPQQGDAWKATYRQARTVVQGLQGARRRELRGAVGVLEGLVLRRELTATRMPAAFLQLQRNIEWWSAHDPPPAPVPSKRPCAGGAGLGGARVTFAGDPVILQWYPGQGLAIQPLATFGKANALWSTCAPGATPGVACRRDELKALLDRMVALGARRGGFLAWEYLFAFGGGRAPWISGITQGTAIQALTRGAQLLGDPAYVNAARDALGAFDAAPPVGVRVPADGGSHYLLYSFAPRLRVLNAFLQALVGIFDFAQATGDAHAHALFAAGDRAARRELPRFDTGAWSRYAQGGSESDLGYHKLVRDFLRSLCTRTGAGGYCALATRFDRYLHERTRVGVRRPGRAVRGRAVALRVTLSKISCVTLRIRRGSRVVGARSLVLARGTHRLPIRPGHAGVHTVEVQARDLAGHVTTVTRTLSVRSR
jgi:D-glucuronyl C5-epimerase C-terminus